ncbi:MAG: malonyl-CoA decarboxylase [Pseudomonadota bacterium]
MQTPYSLLALRQRLTALGVETLELLKLQKRQSFIEIVTNLCRTLLQLKGEASSVAIAEEILHLFKRASDEEKKQFFRYLYSELGADAAIVNKAITDYQSKASQLTLHSLALATESQRLELFRTLNTAPDGTMALIDMREDLYKLMAKEPEFNLLDQELLSLFRAWFNRGFLELRRIDWQTPALILEKLIQYESVHAITGWADLRRRLESDRFCYGFFHPAIKDVPLIFVEVALTDAISNNIANLLQQDPPGSDPVPADTAVFYSINNCLLGLRGVSFGNFLIKQVVEHLATAQPGITNFVTLSPIPGFMHWLKSFDKLATLLTPDEVQAVSTLLEAKSMRSVINSNSLLYKVLPRLCAYYLVKAKSREKPADPVARFHLGNGARLERINWMADSSDNGIAQSAGLMVNYVYDKQTLAMNHEAYEHQNKMIYSSGIQKLLA